MLEGAHFCGQCGARQEAPPPVAPPPVEAIPEQPPNATANTVHDVEARNPKTAPMLQMPEFDGPGGASGGVRPTLPMAEGQARVHARPEVPRPPQLARRLAWSTLGLVACAGLALLIVGVRGGSFAPWRSETPPVPSAVWLPSPEGEGGTEAVATPPAEEPEVSASPEPERPPAQSPSGSAPAAPKPAPPAAPKPAPPAAPLPVPPVPVPPLPTTPSPAPPAPPPPLSLPQLPWTLPTAGACERCVQALRGTGHYIVVTAVTEALLCEDRAARESCEREIAEVAPEVAERAAREGNCTAALATVAAAVNVRVGPERFGAVNALCLR